MVQLVFKPIFDVPQAILRLSSHFLSWKHEYQCQETGRLSLEV